MMVELTELIDKLESGSRPKGGVKNGGTGIPSLGAEHLNGEGGFTFKKIKFVPEDFFKNQKKGLINKDDILIVKDGATTGKVSYVNEAFPYENASINEHVFKISLNKNRAIPKYVFWHLFSQIGRNQILEDFRGATVGGISRGFTKNVKFPLPPLEEQKRIVRILDQADSLRQKRQKAISLLDDYLKVVFLEMFGDALSSSELENKELREYIKVVGGYAFKSKDFVKEGIPVIKIGTVNKGYFDLKACSYMEENIFDNQKISKYKILPGDLLISLTGTVGKEDYGNICLANDDCHTYLLNQRVAKIDYDKEIFTSEFLFHYFKQPEVKRQLTVVSRGVRQANINNEDILKLKMVVPPINKQKVFSGVCIKKQLIRKQMLTQSKKLDLQFQALMQQLFKS